MSSFRCDVGVEYQFGTDNLTAYSGQGSTQNDWLSDYNDQITWAEVKQISVATRVTDLFFKASKDVLGKDEGFNLYQMFRAYH